MANLISRKIIAVARKTLAYFGYVSFPAQASHHYVRDYFGRSAKKQEDIRYSPIFGNMAAKAISEGKTLLYYDRLFTIYQALLNLKRLVSGDQALHIAEVGVYKGGGSHFMLSVLRAHEIFNVQLHSFDTFEGHVSADIKSVDTFQKPGMFQDTLYDSVRDYLAPFSNFSLYRGRFQDTSFQVESLRFGFVHLDVDLYDVTRYGLDFYDSKLVNGGMIVVDDYDFVTCAGVKQAVDEFARERPDYAGFHLLSGQFLLVKSVRH